LQQRVVHFGQAVNIQGVFDQGTLVPQLADQCEFFCTLKRLLSAVS